MTKYTDRFADTWRDINRLKIDLDFLVRSLMVYQLGEHYESFQQRKRESRISKLTIDDLTSQLLKEELTLKKKDQPSTVMATKANERKKPRSKGNKNRSKGHDIAICVHYKKSPEDCWYKNPNRAPE